MCFYVRIVNEKCYFIVCNYNPPGNYIGQKPYVSGTSTTIISGNEDGTITTSTAKSWASWVDDLASELNILPSYLETISSTSTSINLNIYNNPTYTATNTWKQISTISKSTSPSAQALSITSVQTGSSGGTTTTGGGGGSSSGGGGSTTGGSSDSSGGGGGGNAGAIAAGVVVTLVVVVLVGGGFYVYQKKKGSLPSFKIWSSKPEESNSPISDALLPYPRDPAPHLPPPATPSPPPTTAPSSNYRPLPVPTNKPLPAVPARV